MNENTYRVQKAASGTREFLTDALPLGEAIAHLKSIAENMQANGYLKTDRMSIRKLPVIVLAKDLRTVALAVVDCTTETDETTAIPLAGMQWLVRSVQLAPDLRDSTDYWVDVDQTPTDGLVTDELREGSDTVEVAYV